MDYFYFFMITLTLSTIFAIAGTGSGIAVIPVLHMMGIDFNTAKAVGLFVGFCSTSTSTVMNIKRSVLDRSFVVPLLLGFVLFAPLGAQLSRYTNATFVKLAFIIFLLFSAAMMSFFDKSARIDLASRGILWIVGAGVGLLAGVLGVGGGNILLPLLIVLGFEAKKVSITASFVIPFSTMGSFLSYISFVDMDWTLLATCSIAAVVGGYTGNYLMHYRLSQREIRRLVAVMLCILAIKMGWDMV